MARLLVVAAVFVSLLVATSADADTLLLEAQAGPRFEITVTASDGLTQASDSVSATEPFAGLVVATPQGILNPELLVSSIAISYPETTVDLAFGIAEIPATMTFSASYEWAPNQVLAFGASRVPVSSGLLISFSMTGQLEVFEETIPFDFSLADYEGGTDLNALWSAEDEYEWQFVQPRLLLSPSPPPGTIILIPASQLSADLGSAGGVDFHLDVAQLVAESMTFGTPAAVPSLSALGIGTLLSVLGALAYRRLRARS